MKTLSPSRSPAKSSPLQDDDLSELTKKEILFWSRKLQLTPSELFTLNEEELEEHLAVLNKDETDDEKRQECIKRWQKLTTMKRELLEQEQKNGRMQGGSEPRPTMWEILMRAGREIEEWYEWRARRDRGEEEEEPSPDQSSGPEINLFDYTKYSGGSLHETCDSFDYMSNIEYSGYDRPHRSGLGDISSIRYSGSPQSLHESRITNQALNESFHDRSYGWMECYNDTPEEIHNSALNEQDRSFSQYAESPPGTPPRKNPSYWYQNASDNPFGGSDAYCECDATFHLPPTPQRTDNDRPPDFPELCRPPPCAPPLRPTPVAQCEPAPTNSPELNYWEEIYMQNRTSTPQSHHPKPLPRPRRPRQLLPLLEASPPTSPSPQRMRGRPSSDYSSYAYACGPGNATFNMSPGGAVNRTFSASPCGPANSTFNVSPGGAANSTFAIPPGGAGNRTFTASPCGPGNATFNISSGGGGNSTFAVAPGGAGNSTFNAGPCGPGNTTFKVSPGGAGNSTFAVAPGGAGNRTFNAGPCGPGNVTFNASPGGAGNRTLPAASGGAGNRSFKSSPCSPGNATFNASYSSGDSSSIYMPEEASNYSDERGDTFYNMTTCGTFSDPEQTPSNPFGNDCFNLNESVLKRPASVERTFNVTPGMGDAAFSSPPGNTGREIDELPWDSYEFDPIMASSPKPSRRNYADYHLKYDKNGLQENSTSITIDGCNPNAGHVVAKSRTFYTPCSDSPANATYNVGGAANATYNLQGAANATYNVGAANATYNVGAANTTYNAGCAANTTYNAGAANATYNAGAANATFNKGCAANTTYNVGAANATYNAGAANATFNAGCDANTTYNVGAANTTYSVGGGGNATFNCSPGRRGQGNATFNISGGGGNRGAANATFNSHNCGRQLGGENTPLLERSSSLRYSPRRSIRLSNSKQSLDYKNVTFNKLKEGITLLQQEKQNIKEQKDLRELQNQREQQENKEQREKTENLEELQAEQRCRIDSTELQLLRDKIELCEKNYVSDIKTESLQENRVGQDTEIRQNSEQPNQSEP